jgi:Na+-transporting NADH:ubiquinone oxidoreductase subunit F
LSLDFLVAPFVVGAISSILAVIISVIDMIVNNYGEVKLSINGGKKELTVKGGSSLLSSLGEQDIFLPSACGGRATCGVCKIKVISDVGPHLPTELPFLTKEEIGRNIRLSCQIKVKTDLEVEIPEELFAIQKYATMVSSIRDLTHDIKEVRCRLTEPQRIDFKAGQYAQFVIPPYGKIKQETQRAYSISSSPSQNGELEFIVRLVPGGIATTYVFTMLKEGDAMELIAPLGEFGLHGEHEDMLCIAGGSGMAPIKALLFDMFEKKVSGREIYYFFGVAATRDMFYLDMFYDLEKKWPSFHFVPVIAEPDPGSNWKGETGLVTRPLDTYLKEKLKRDTPKQGYLCGSPGMIDACIKVLTAHGIGEDSIFYDKFA